jgi:hypothetical protein
VKWVESQSELGEQRYFVDEVINIVGKIIREGKFGDGLGWVGSKGRSRGRRWNFEAMLGFGRD